jgi:hypothetical protein
MINFVDDESFNEKFNKEYGYKFGSWYGKIVSFLQSIYNIVYGLSNSAWNKFNENFCTSYRKNVCPSVDINTYREEIVCLEEMYFDNVE